MAENKSDTPAPDVADVNVTNASPQDAAIAELRALVETLQAQVAASGGANAAAAPVMPQVGFDKGTGSQPYVVMTHGDETIDVQARHLHILQALGWELRGSSLKH